jgi:hypothetical protein
MALSSTPVMSPSSLCSSSRMRALRAVSCGSSTGAAGDAKRRTDSGAADDDCDSAAGLHAAESAVAAAAPPRA